MSPSRPSKLPRVNIVPVVSLILKGELAELDPKR